MIETTLDTTEHRLRGDFSWPPGAVRWSQNLEKGLGFDFNRGSKPRSKPPGLAWDWWDDGCGPAGHGLDDLSLVSLPTNPMRAQEVLTLGWSQNLGLSRFWLQRTAPGRAKKSHLLVYAPCSTHFRENHGRATNIRLGITCSPMMAKAQAAWAAH